MARPERSRTADHPASLGDSIAASHPDEVFSTHSCRISDWVRCRGGWRSRRKPRRKPHTGKVVTCAAGIGAAGTIADAHRCQAGCAGAGARIVGKPAFQIYFRRRPRWVYSVQRRRFLVGASPSRQMLQPEATGAAIEVTKWLKPSDSVSRICGSAGVQAVTRVRCVASLPAWSTLMERQQAAGD
jgi:hypothetical protein